MNLAFQCTFTLAGSLLGALCLTSTAVAQTPPASSDAAHGIRMSMTDPSVRPGDDFFLYANGAWFKSAVIPPDRASSGSFRDLAERTSHQVATLIAAAAASSPGIQGAGSDGRAAAATTDAGRIAAVYQSYMDEATLERRGLSPIKPELERIAAIRNRHDLAHELGLTLRADVDALNNTNYHTAHLFGLWVAPGFADPDHYAPYLLQGGLVLPSRDYYLDASPHMQEVRAKYAAHAAAMFRLAGGLAGASEAAAESVTPEARAQRVIALEHDIAAQQVSLADSENIEHANNRWLAADFSTKAPGLDWAEFFRAAGLSQQAEFYVWQPSAFRGESALVASAPLEAWKDWLTLHALEEAYLTKAFSDEEFAFFGSTLSGTTQQRPREQRAIALVNRVVGDAVGKLYVEQYFPPQAKAGAQALVNNLLAAFHQRLEAITWMAPETKAEALRKLATLQVSVGYPDHWRSYEGLEIRSDDLFGNGQRAGLFDYHYALSRIGQPVARKEWVMEPQTVNAVNLPLDNALNFPAAILQPPFFDPQAPDADNYGAIGAVIGHEISHTFDSEGAAFDSQGRVRNWWTSADLAHFNAATAALAAQYDTYEPLPGLHVNGRQTLGEDIADLGGVTASLDAFHASLHGQPAPVAGGLSGDQQFFIAFGQAWQYKARDAALRQQVLTDPHAPAPYRAATVRNLDAWYNDFNVQPGEKLYLSPNDRVHIW